MDVLCLRATLSLLRGSRILKLLQVPESYLQGLAVGT